MQHILRRERFTVLDCFTSKRHVHDVKTPSVHEVLAFHAAKGSRTDAGLVGAQAMYLNASFSGCLR